MSNVVMSRIVFSERGNSRRYTLQLTDRPIGQFHAHMLQAISGSHVFRFHNNDSNALPIIEHVSSTIETENDTDVVNTIPVYTAEGDVGECSICINNIQKGDEFRRLPCSDTVNHCFHRGCIDTWLKSNNTCPNCRSDIFNT